MFSPGDILISNDWLEVWGDTLYPWHINSMGREEIEVGSDFVFLSYALDDYEIIVLSPKGVPSHACSRDFDPFPAP